MKYLRKFNTEADVQMFVKPNVVLINDTGKVLYNVEPPVGVYVQHIDGSLYTTTQWTEKGFSNDLANGVAVVANEASFVISKLQISDSLLWSSNTEEEISGVTLTSDKDVAMADYNGESNTAIIAMASTMGAANECANYVFPNGNKGYLPALGEWEVAFANKAQIDAAMSLIGGTAIKEAYHWTSTQYSASRAWTRTWSGNYQGNYSKITRIPVRAFTSL